MFLALTAIRHPPEVLESPVTTLLTEATYTIGRGEECNIVLKDPRRHISRKHATIVHQDGAYQLAVNSKINPVVLNGTAVPMGESVPLSDGDQLAIGDYVFAVVAQDAAQKKLDPMASFLGTASRPAPTDLDAVLGPASKAPATPPPSRSKIDDLIDERDRTNRDPLLDILGGGSTARPASTTPSMGRHGSSPGMDVDSFGLGGGNRSSSIDDLLGGGISPSADPLGLGKPDLHQRADAFGHRRGGSLDLDHVHDVHLPFQAPSNDSRPAPRARPEAPAPREAPRPNAQEHAGDPLESLFGASPPPVSRGRDPLGLLPEPGAPPSPGGVKDPFGPPTETGSPMSPPRGKGGPPGLSSESASPPPVGRGKDPFDPPTDTGMPLPQPRGKPDPLGLESVALPPAGRGKGPFDPAAETGVPQPRGKPDPLGLESVALPPAGRGKGPFDPAAETGVPLPRPRGKPDPLGLESAALPPAGRGKDPFDPAAETGVPVQPPQGKADPLGLLSRSAAPSPAARADRPEEPPRPTPRAPAARPRRDPLGLLTDSEPALPAPDEQRRPDPLGPLAGRASGSPVPHKADAPSSEQTGLGQHRPQPVAPVPVAAEQGGASARPDAASIAALLAGAEMAGVKIRDDQAEAFLRESGAVIRAAVEGLMSLLLARATVKEELRASEMTMVSAQRNNPLKMISNVEEAVRHVLDPSVQSPAFLRPREAVADACADLRAHEVAVVAGMRSAVLGAIKRFDPARIERELEKKGGVILNRKAKLWECFLEYHAKTTRDAEDSFDKVFGADFARAYQQHVEAMKKR